MNLDSLNPYPAWRQGQREACQAIVEAVQDGQKIITYKGPTGSGKSLVLSVAARALLEEGTIKRATYTTPQRQLVYQLAGDERLGITGSPRAGQTPLPQDAPGVRRGLSGASQGPARDLPALSIPGGQGCLCGCLSGSHDARQAAD